MEERTTLYRGRAQVDYYGYIAMRTSSAAALFILSIVNLQARDYGPPIGSRMPNFNLPDQDGKAHTLKSVLGPKGAVILVFRSADW